jgi:hypothetical protein
MPKHKEFEVDDKPQFLTRLRTELNNIAYEYQIVDIPKM